MFLANRASVVFLTMRAVPQLVWLSEHKTLVFGFAALMLIASGIMLRHAEHLPCPVEPRAAAACQRLRRVSRGLYGIAVTAFVVASGFVAASRWM